MNPSPVHVCFMIDRLRAAGTESQVLALIRGLDRRKVIPSLCLLDGEDPISRGMEPEDCPILRLGVRSLHCPATIIQALRLARFLKQHRVDIFDVHFPDSMYFGIPVARLAGVRRIVRNRRDLGYWLTPWHRRLGRWYSHLVDATLANCEACRQAVIADDNIAPHSVHIVNNGIDLSRYVNTPPLRMPPDGRCRRIGVIANLRPVKDLDVFVAAAARIAAGNPDVAFILAGEGELRTALEAQIRQLGLTQRFSLPGTIRDIPALLAELDIAVLCSRSEGLSNALLEYMAAGRAIVATAVGGNTELIEDGVNGLLFPVGQEARLAEALQRLLDEPNLAMRLGMAARQKAFEHFGLDAMVARYVDFSRRLAYPRSTGE